MDTPHFVVVQRGTLFETATVTEIRATSVRLHGGWTHADFGATTCLFLGGLEWRTTVVDSSPGQVTLRSLDAEFWPPEVRRELIAAWDQLGPTVQRSRSESPATS